MNRRQPMYERVMPSLEHFRKTGRLLEIGCSYGYFLEMARSFGWRAEGVEISGYASEVARSKGFEIHQGELQTLALDPGSYDVIVMWDVIEHLLNPAVVVERCADLLMPGGVVVARTPNARALGTTGGLLGLAYKQLAYPANTPEHVFHFTPESLSSLLRKKGFGRVETDEYGGWEERIISGRNVGVRMGRYLIMRYAIYRQWPYEFLITAVKE
jgi:2-polyprenyl-3-methyl-5-hydroxy-6-metoxy-1,4-benzoquinol methylase